MNGFSKIDLITILTASNLEAFEIWTGVMPLPGMDGGCLYSDTQGAKDYAAYDSTNTIFEIGYFKDTYQEEFGFG